MYRVIERPYEKILKEETSYQSLARADFRTVTIRDLEPSTKYEVKIAALTRIGMGSYAILRGYTSPATGK